MWRHGQFAEALVRCAPGFAGRDEPAPYDPVAFQAAYAAVLRHRNVDVVRLEVILPTEKLSVYDFSVIAPQLTPTEAEAEQFIRRVEGRHPDPAALDREIGHWWEV